MSVNMTHYFGIGIKLTDGEIEDYDPFHDLEDKYPECSEYQFIRNSIDTKSNIRIIVDGMNGMYSYLIYLIKETGYENIWDSECTADFSIDSLDIDDMNKLKEIYKEFTGSELSDSDLKIISLFHAS